MIQWKTLDYNATNKETIANYLDNPTLLFGKKSAPYGVMLTDDIGDSISGGGRSFILGYTYSTDLYGAQLLIKYNDLKFRKKYNGNWTATTTIA